AAAQCALAHMKAVCGFTHSGEAPARAKDHPPQFSGKAVCCIHVTQQLLTLSPIHLRNRNIGGRKRAVDPVIRADETIELMIEGDIDTEITAIGFLRHCRLTGKLHATFSRQRTDELAKCGENTCEEKLDKKMGRAFNLERRHEREDRIVARE